MRNITAKISVLLALIFTISSHAQADEKYGYNEMMATQYARWISQMQSADDMTELLPMAEKNKALIKAENKKSKANFTSLKVSMIQPTKLEVVASDGSKIYISFRQFDKSNLYINDKGMKLAPHKTFLNYQAEIDAILNEKSAQFKFSLIESAYAQSKNTVRNVAASVAVSNAYVLYRGGLQKDVEAEPTPKNIEKVLIQAFKNESDRAKGIDKQNRRAPFFTAFVFTCSGGKLATVENKILVSGGALANQGMSKLVRVDGKSFKYTDNMCSVKISDAGQYLSGKRGSCAIETDFSSGPPFFGFTDAASQCCKKKGCAEAVKAETEKVAATHVRKKAKSAQ